MTLPPSDRDAATTAARAMYEAEISAAGAHYRQAITDAATALDIRAAMIEAAYTARLTEIDREHPRKDQP